MSEYKIPKCKMCKTVGALITELQKLPSGAPLQDSLRPIYYNAGPQSKKMGLTPIVGFQEGEP